MKKSKGIISLILTVVLIALLGFTTVVGFGKGQTGAAKNIKLGLDLEGGVSITYQVKGETPSAEDMSDTIYKLQKRVEQYSTEATVYQEGDDRISIEIPGVTDANEILSELGQPGSLYFIKEKDSDGNPNYGLDTSGHYVLAKSMDELKEEGSVVLTGTDIKSAKSGSYQDSTTGANKNVVQLSMTKEGTEKFAEATKAAKEAEETIAIYYDGELISVPRVNAEITDGQAIIEGSMEYEEAEQLAKETFGDIEHYRDDLIWHTAYKMRLRQGVIQEGYQMKIARKVSLEDGCNYRLRVWLRNGDVAWVSPIFCRK